MTSPESPAVQDMDRLRVLATILAKDRAARWRYTDTLNPAELARFVQREASDPNLLADLAALLPVHREMVLTEAAHMILDHRDRHFPADGNDVQRRARRILQIAVQVVSPTPTRGQLAEKLVEMGVLDRAASTPPGAPGPPQTAERAAAVPGTGDDQAACDRCRRRFDPDDKDPAGAARYAESKFCRGCVDRCHESTDAFHECPVCAS